MGALDGRITIITGAGRGLGRAHALLFAAEGARVVVNDLGSGPDGDGGDPDAAEAVVAEIVAAGGEAVANHDDVSTWEGGERLVQAAIDAFGGLDVLVNNAGILRDRALVHMSEEEWDSVTNVHLKGHFVPTRFAANYWRDQSKAGTPRKAAVIHTSSTSGLLGNPGQTNYGAAKMGLVGLANVLAVEGAKYNIKANVIAPVAATRMTEDLLGPLLDKLGPEYITPIAVYLASEQCEVTGEIYTCGGGRVARVFIGATQGFTDPDLSVESVAENLAKIRDEDGYEVPANLNEEMGMTLKALS